MTKKRRRISIRIHFLEYGSLAMVASRDSFFGFGKFLANGSVGSITWS